MSDIVLSIWDFFWIWWIVVLMGGSAYLKAHSLLASAEFHGASDKIVIMSIPDDAATRIRPLHGISRHCGRSKGGSLMRS